MQKSTVGSKKAGYFGKAEKHVSKTLTKKLSVSEATIKDWEKSALYT